MKNDKLNKKLVIERAIPKEKKTGGNIFFSLFIILLICTIVAFLILEYLGYFNYLDFI